MSVVCGDLDQTMVDLVAQRIKENGWHAKAEKLDAQVTRSFSFTCRPREVQILTVDMIKDLPYSDEHFTHVLMNFGPQLMPDPIKALRGE